MKDVVNALKNYFSWLQLPEFDFIDLLEIGLIAYAVYQIIIWIKKSRAWTLLKGLVMLFAICGFAILFNMNVILWIFDKCLAVGITVLVVVFQPELRKALEQLGRNQFMSSLFFLDDNKSRGEGFSAKTINEIVRATFELARTKTGALIVIANQESLAEYERTGIVLDAMISSQLLINIFEHNTPLHDGAIVVKDERIVAATCYLPLSDNMGLSKELGTRHRAGVGISEVTDSMTIIVSEETGKVSIAVGGELIRNVDGEYLKSRLENRTGNEEEDRKFKIRNIINKKKEM
ncbi:MAG: diadenylate cyclase CdaA [Lachnospiraceae bacterium]|nr:diadenylate cyclase CdaA [Lachnospiraceae bacterium]